MMIILKPHPVSRLNIEIVDNPTKNINQTFVYTTIFRPPRVNTFSDITSVIRKLNI